MKYFVMLVVLVTSSHLLASNKGEIIAHLDDLHIGMKYCHKKMEDGSCEKQYPNIKKLVEINSVFPLLRGKQEVNVVVNVFNGSIESLDTEFHISKHDRDIMYKEYGEIKKTDHFCIAYGKDQTSLVIPKFRGDELIVIHLIIAENGEQNCSNISLAI